MCDKQTGNGDWVKITKGRQTCFCRPKNVLPVSKEFRWLPGFLLHILVPVKRKRVGPTISGSLIYDRGGEKAIAFPLSKSGPRTVSHLRNKTGTRKKPTDLVQTVDEFFEPLEPNVVDCEVILLRHIVEVIPLDVDGDTSFLGP